MASSVDGSLPAAARPPPPPPPVQMVPWLLLSRVHKDVEIPDGASFHLTPVAPPGISSFALARTMFLGDTADPPFPFIVAADDCGRRFLVLTEGPSSSSRLAALQLMEDVPAQGIASPSSTAPAEASPSPPTTAGAASSASGHAVGVPPTSPGCGLVVCDVSRLASLQLMEDVPVPVLGIASPSSTAPTDASSSPPTTAGAASSASGHAVGVPPTSPRCGLVVCGLFSHDALQHKEDVPVPSSTAPTGASSSPPTTAGAASSPSAHAVGLPPSSPRLRLVVCDVLTQDALDISDADNVGITDADNVGIMTAPGGERYVVAKLDFHAAAAAVADNSSTCTLERYWSITGRWTRTVLAHPPPARQHSYDSVFPHRRRLWWADVASGVLNLDPFAKRPILKYIPLPVGFEIDQSDCPCSLKKLRCINVSSGNLRFAVIVHDNAATDTVKIWTLNCPDSGGFWSYDYSVTLADIWASGLPATKPHICLVHPIEPHMLYLLSGNHIFCVDLRNKEITDCILDPLASCFVFPWPFAPRVSLPPDMPEDNMASLVMQHLQRLQNFATDGENAFNMGVRLSNLANRIMQLNSRLTGTTERINQAMPYLEMFAETLGDGAIATLGQQFVVLLKYLCQSSSGIAVASRACSVIGLRLQQRHPTAQTGARVQTTPIPEPVIVRNMEEANEVINEWKETQQLVVAEIEQDLGREEAIEIYRKFRHEAFDLIKDSSVLLAKIQDPDETDWVTV
ncbi:uncharacterized protein [Lolium perenne]|uniref:uncharacterized protein n=1 Tax=Lolium perenne TaxID=4522 RepID=UPI0021EAE486